MISSKKVGFTMNKYFLTIAVVFATSCQLAAQQSSNEPFLRSQFAIEILEAREDESSLLGATISQTTDAAGIPGYALNLIGHFEGWFPEKYDDPAGYCTIGYGRLFKKDSCNNLTREEIEAHVTIEEWENGISKERGLELLEEDLLVARRFVAKLTTVETTEDQFGSLVSFTFNVGGGNFQRSTLLKKVNVSDFQGAVFEFPRWVRAGGEVLRGLQIRRNCEATLFSGALSERNSENFSRLDCQTFGTAIPSVDLVDIETGE